MHAERKGPEERRIAHTERKTHTEDKEGTAVERRLLTLLSIRATWCFVLVYRHTRGLFSGRLTQPHPGPAACFLLELNAERTRGGSWPITADAEGVRVLWT